MFFGILDQFLSPLTSGDYFKSLGKDEERTHINYFDFEGYLDWFDGTNNKEFA